MVLKTSPLFINLFLYDTCNIILHKGTPCKDIYGTDSYPSVDGVDVWGLHTASTAAARSNVSAAHESLWLSAEVLLQGDYKLVVAQQEPKKTNNPPIYGWKCNSPQLNSTPSARCDTRNSSAEPYEQERRTMI